MTWSGATSLLQGQEVTGRDAEIVTWIYGLVKIECQECHLIWFVPESQLGFYLLHFLYDRTSIAWCRHCQVMTLVRLSHVGGIWIS
jgi:hypothetical protein